MKRIKSAFALFTIMLLICGCSIKTEYKMDIKKDKSMDFSIIAAFDNELIDGMLSSGGTFSSDGNTETTVEDENQIYEDENSVTQGEIEFGSQNMITDEQRWEFIEEFFNSNDRSGYEQYGYNVEKYENGEYKGYKYTKKISNIDDISGDVINFNLENFEEISNTVVFIKEGQTYRTNFKMSSEEEASSSQGYNVGIDMIFSVTLPNKPISHNANTVSEDGKTLTWTLKDSGLKDIQFEFSFKNEIPYLEIGIVAAIVLFVFIIALSLLLGNRKNKKGMKPQSTVEQPVQPQPAVEQSTQTEPTIEQSLQSQPAVEQPMQMPTIEQSLQSQPAVEQPMQMPTIEQSLQSQPAVEQPTQIPTIEQSLQPQPAVEQPVQIPTIEQSLQTEPTIDQPQVIPDQALKEMPSVADIISMAEQNNNSNK